MKNLPPLSSLRSFCVAAKHQSFTKAANELNQTHGAISRAVKQLEEHFGTQLFERRNRRLYITPKGEVFAERIGNLLQQMENACEELAASVTENKLVISCDPTLAMRWLMPRLESYKQHAPELDIYLSTEGGPIDLAANGVDVAIRRSDFKWQDDYWVTTLDADRIGPVCTPAYWAQNTDTAWTLLHSRTRPSAWKDWAHHAQEAPSYDNEHYFDHFYFSIQAAVAGMGIAMTSQALVRDDLNNGLLIAPFGFTKIPLDYVALTLRNPETNGHIRTFTQWAAQEFQKKTENTKSLAP